nr:amidohydrolase family protein [Ilumatobacteraceae bacterium]
TRDDDGVIERVRGRVVTGGRVVVGEVVLDDGTVVEVRGLDEESLGPDADRWVVPAFVDVQINGSDGIDLATEPHRIAELAALLPAEGTGAFLPTVVTGPAAVREAAIAAVGAVDIGPGAAVPLGLHLEGPLLSFDRRGAHRVEHLQLPVTCDTSGWTRANGVAMVTLAPELPGALDVVRLLVADGVVVSIGHTDATAEQVVEAVDAGASAVTHLFNAMRPFGHRDPGPIGVALTDDRLTVGLICDGVHVDPRAVALVWRAVGPERLQLVTDAVAARGIVDAPDGVRLADGTLAGSTIALDRALANLVDWTGASVPEAVRTVTSTPARLLGRSDVGVIEPGSRAGVVVLDGAGRRSPTR